MTSLLTNGSIALLSCFKSYRKHRRYGIMSVIIIPSASGKTSLCSALKLDADNYNVFDIEQIVIDSMDTSTKTQLATQKQNDLIAYENTLYSAIGSKIYEIREHLASIKDKKHQIYVVSSLNGKRIIQMDNTLHQSIYCIPSKTLFDSILTKLPLPLKTYVTATRDGIINAEKDPHIYTNFETLYTVICSHLHITPKV